MNLRHAAAFSLLGWYLMVPPPAGSTNRIVNPDASLVQWRIYKSFDTATECENDRAEIVHDHENQTDVLEKYARLSACIATDDPRLKSK